MQEIVKVGQRLFDREKTKKTLVIIIPRGLGREIPVTVSTRPLPNVHIGKTQKKKSQITYSTSFFFSFSLARFLQPIALLELEGEMLRNRYVGF